MSISVIIPTYNRPQTLLQALSSLQGQDYSGYEVIVVDNAADPEVEKLIFTFNQTAKVSVRYVREVCVGLHQARHAGAREAKGTILVFTDDDATFAPGWLQAYAGAFDEHPEMVASGGPVRPIWETPPPAWLLEFKSDSRQFPILSLLEQYQEFRLEPKGIFFGVNMAIRRNVLFDVGGFNPEAFGDIWLGDGETGLNQKLWQQGMLIGYVPEAVVYHHIPAHRMTVEYFCHRMANEGACTEYGALHGMTPGWMALLSRAAIIGYRLARVVPATAARALLKQDRFALLKARMELSYNLSRLFYILRLFYDKQRRELVAKKNWLEA